MGNQTSTKYSDAESIQGKEIVQSNKARECSDINNAYIVSQSVSLHAKSLEESFPPDIGHGVPVASQKSALSPQAEAHEQSP